MKLVSRISTLVALLAVSTLSAALLAQEPPVNISPQRHPALASAQSEIRAAWFKVDAAQKANDWDMQGHAAHARQLLFEAGEQLRQAATAANKNAGPKPPVRGDAGPEPVIDISHERHPALATAQVEIREAWRKTVAAQRANDWDMDGHAQKAKDLIFQASEEIRAAATAANEDGHHRR